MAVTYTPNDAFNYAKYMIKGMRLQDVQYQILDEAYSRVWNAAAWPWTIGYLTTTTVQPSTVTYGVSYPNDFATIYKAVLFDSDKVYKPLFVDPELPEDPQRVGQTISVAAIPDQSYLRIYPQPPATLPSTQPYIITFYKKTPAKITSSNAGTACLVMDDQWFHVYKSAVLISAYKYADDARGFDITIDTAKNWKMGGELAHFEYLIKEMKQSNKFPYEWDVYAEAKGESK